MKNLKHYFLSILVSYTFLTLLNTINSMGIKEFLIKTARRPDKPSLFFTTCCNDDFELRDYSMPLKDVQVTLVNLDYTQATVSIEYSNRIYSIMIESVAEGISCCIKVPQHMNTSEGICIYKKQPSLKSSSLQLDHVMINKILVALIQQADKA